MDLLTSRYPWGCMQRRLDLFFGGWGWEGGVTSYTLGVRVRGIVESDGVVICIFFFVISS